MEGGTEFPGSRGYIEASAHHTRNIRKIFRETIHVLNRWRLFDRYGMFPTLDAGLTHNERTKNSRQRRLVREICR